jgi:C-terminal processing protease CtpA/Prc
VNEPQPRLGLSWRTEAEPGTVFLTRVIDGTPAQAAGLATLDRIQDVNGQPFADSDAFGRTIQEVLQSGAEQLTLRVERNGHVRTVRQVRSS